MATPNYNEQSAKDTPGKTYRRIRYLGIWNPEVGIPHVDILEADAAFIDGVKTKIRDSGGDSGRVVDAAELDRMVELRNPATDEIVPGQAFPVKLLHAMLYSYGRDCQAIRDCREPAITVYGIDAQGYSTGANQTITCNLYGGHTIPDGFVRTPPPPIPPASPAGTRAKWDGSKWIITTA